MMLTQAAEPLLRMLVDADTDPAFDASQAEPDQERCHGGLGHVQGRSRPRVPLQHRRRAARGQGLQTLMLERDALTCCHGEAEASSELRELSQSVLLCRTAEREMRYCRGGLSEN